MDKKATALAESVLAWWKEHEFDTRAIGDGDYANVFDYVPDFVIKAAEYLGLDSTKL